MYHCSAICLSVQRFCCHLFGIVIHSILVFSPFMYCQSFYFCSLLLCLYPQAKCPAVFPGWLVPSISPGSVSLCTFSLVMLSEQEISHSIRLKRSRCADKAHAEGAPSPCCSICRPRLASCLSTQDICIFSPSFTPILSISLHLPSNSTYLLAPLDNILIFFLFPTASHSDFIHLSPTKALSNSAFI